MINPQWLELPMSRTNFLGPRDVRAIEVQLYNILTPPLLNVTISHYSYQSVMIAWSKPGAGLFLTPPPPPPKKKKKKTKKFKRDLSFFSDLHYKWNTSLLFISLHYDCLFNCSKSREGVGGGGGGVGGGQNIIP